MKRFLFLLLLLPSLTLSIVGCKDDKVASVATSNANTSVAKEDNTTAIPKRVVSVSNSDNVSVKVQESDNVISTTKEGESIDNNENTTPISSTADDLIEKALATKPTAKIIPKPAKKVAKKPVKKPKPDPVKSAPKKYLPKIEFEEMSHDFGEITEGDIIKHNFTFTNTGKTNLSIEKATATCGCTKPSFPFIDIKPGETGYIGVVYNSVSKDGDQKPEITVYSNAFPKETVLSLTGTVKPKPKEDKEEEADAEEMPQDTIKY